MTRSNIGFIILVIVLLALIGYISLGDLISTFWGDSATAESPPEILVDTGEGPTVVTGMVTYRDSRFVQSATAPIIVLEDQAGFIDRDPNFVPSPESQTLGQITTDLHTSPFYYSLILPIKPQGSVRDVDQDNRNDIGVMVFAVAYWNDIFGGPFLEQRDMFGGGWSKAYASTQIRSEPEFNGEVSGGKYIVYAPEVGQGFPNDFGPDQKLFTSDDPIVLLQQGYTVVNMETRPFAFTRPNRPVIDLIEPVDSQIDDFSSFTYTRAFELMIDKFRAEYAFTEQKSIDWERERSRFRPLFQEAEDTGNVNLYLTALNGFLRAIPDGQLSASIFYDQFTLNTEGGIGLAVTEIADGFGGTSRVVVSYLMENGPADQAGIKLGAEIVTINDNPVEAAIQNAIPWNEHSSTPNHLKIQKLRALLRFPLNTAIKIVYQNPEGALASTSLTAIEEDRSQSPDIPATALNEFGPPLEYELLEDGYAYVKIYRFPDNSRLSVQLWEDLLTKLNTYEVPGLIMDVRYNRGGNIFLADQLSAYLLEGQRDIGGYQDFRNNFQLNRDTIRTLYPPPTGLSYGGNLSILIGPDCRRECELFVNNLTQRENTQIVGQHPTAGQGGIISQFLMPEEQWVQYTSARAVDLDGQVQIEGRGVIPKIRVPNSVAKVSTSPPNDVVIQSAVENLDKARGIQPTPIPIQGSAFSEIIWGTINLTGGVLNVRSAPNLNSQIIGTVPNRSAHIIQNISKDQAWLLINVSGTLEDGGNSGWVRAEAVRYKIP